jgi:coxsackievirus/adenovirus receptor
MAFGDRFLLAAIASVSFVIAFQAGPSAGQSSSHNRVPCYGTNGRALRCFPPFVNAAFNVPVEATNTCGRRGPEDYCQQTGISGATKSCDVCDERDPAKAHPSKYLTDFHSVDNLSWWQSGTMMSDVQWPNMVNLTLSLGKAFEITYVRLKFHSSRPESFAIYKRTNESQQWGPYQFYSSSCYETYGMNVRTLITPENEAQAVCRDDFSDISPLTGASVAFSTLEGRPSAYNFENSPELQEWVTATDIRIVLNRINTFRDEVFGDPNVLRSYFYAISDFAVGGRCKCNGHASDCVKTTGQNLEERLVCQCQHNTTGPDCGECLPFYNDQPWHRATAADAHECQPCNCNGLSNRCYFDEELYRRTGHGGHCSDCRENTFGVNCERCRDNYYRRNSAQRCQRCNCNPTGSQNLQCDIRGVCQCKPGVTGEKCDRCQANYDDFGPAGCRLSAEYD